LKVDEARLMLMLITGERGAGKSTFARHLSQRLTLSEGARFKGYETVFIDKPEGARHLICQPVGFDEKPFRVAVQNLLPYRRILPDTEAFGRMAALLESIDPQTEGVYIDEIGFLETLDDRLQQSILSALTRCPFAIAVIRLGDYPFIRKVKGLRPDAVLELTRENRERLYAQTLSSLGASQTDPVFREPEKGGLKK